MDSLDARKLLPVGAAAAAGFAAGAMYCSWAAAAASTASVAAPAAAVPSTAAAAAAPVVEARTKESQTVLIPVARLEAFVAGVLAAICRALPSFRRCT